MSWIKTAEEMPTSGVAVLVVCEPHHGGRRLINRAIWVAAKTEESGPNSDIGEYDEETDTYYDPEGWYELVSHRDDLGAVGICGHTVTHWSPLPKFPKD